MYDILVVYSTRLTLKSCSTYCVKEVQMKIYGYIHNFPSHNSNLLAGTIWHGVLLLHFAFMHQNLMLNNTTAKWEFYRKKA